MKLFLIQFIVNMDFLNQLDSDNKDENSLFTFNDKNDNNNNKGISLPFPFSSQSSMPEGNDNNNFLNDMKSQDNSFNLSQFGNDNNQNNNNNFGGFDFLNTICEVPESSNNIFDSQANNDFLNPNVGGQNKGGLDFINKDNENENNNNFDFTKFQNTNNDEPINIDINNLFKSSKTKKDFFEKSDESGKNDNFQFNELLNMASKDKGGNNINSNNEKNSNENKIQLNNNIIPVHNNSVIPNNDLKEKIIVNNDLKKTSFGNDNNNKMSSNPIIIENNISKKPLSNNFNQNPISNKENNFSNNIKNFSNNIPSLSGPSSNPIVNGINFNIKDVKDNKENIPSFVNISIKPTTNKPQKNKLDDLDQIISLNTKMENKQNISSIQNNVNILPINQQFFQGKQDNKKIDLGQDKLKFLTNEISNMLNSSLVNNGKRSDLEPNDKDLKNIENLLDFTKEKITSKSQIKRNQNIPQDKNFNSYNQIKNNQNFFINTSQKSTVPVLKQLPSDSFDKKSQLIKLTKNDNICLSQMENSSKIMPGNGENAPAEPSKLEMIQKYNELASRLNKIREKAKEFRNLGNYFNQLIIATENYKAVYPVVLKKLLEEYNNQTEKLLSLMKIKNNKMNEMNNEFFEEVKKYSLAFPDRK